MLCPAEASADQWPEGFGGDDLSRKTASLDDLAAVELDEGEDAHSLGLFPT